jgi:hypothetical protein
MVFSVSQGAVVSAIGHGLISIVSGIAFLIESVIAAIFAVRTIVDKFCGSHLNLLSQVIVAIFDVFTDILCCACFRGRRRTGRRDKGYYRQPTRRTRTRHTTSRTAPTAHRRH